MNQNDHLASYAIFYGTQISSDYQNVTNQERNIDVVKFFSKPTAQFNQKEFLKQIDENLDDDVKSLISQKDEQEEPFIDSYGRITFFTCTLASLELPIYQPGTIMFESATNESEVILGSNDSIALAKFTCTLINNYNEIC